MVRERMADCRQHAYLDAIDAALIPYQELVQAAAAAVDGIMLRVEAGKVEPNEIGKFLKHLKMHTTFTWDMRSSEWFLTMKMLEGVGGVSLEKYSALNDMILLELRANPDTVAPRPSEHYSLVDSHGKAIPKRSFKGNVKHEVPWQIGAFASSLNWLSMRTAFYTIFSSRYEADAMLHPIRSAFQLSLAGRFCLKV